MGGVTFGLEDIAEAAAFSDPAGESSTVLELPISR
jgi:hypothetical protein